MQYAAGVFGCSHRSVLLSFLILWASHREILHSGVAPSIYLARVERNSHPTAHEVDDVLRTHGLDPVTLRSDDFDAHFAYRREHLIGLIEDAMRKTVQRDVEVGELLEDASEFEIVSDDEEASTA